MSRIELIDADRPLPQLLTEALRYPLRDAALPGLVAFTLGHYLSLIPTIGWLLEMIVWAATYLYALECLRHSADGFAAPPEFAEPGRAGWVMVLIMLLATLLTGAMNLYVAGAGWLVSVGMALVLPTIAMSLALDGSMLLALNPVTWLEVMSRFGWRYLLLVGVQLLIALLVGVAQEAFEALLPQLIAIPFFYGVAVYATLFNFHLMGVLLHQRHDQFGLQPKAMQLAQALHHDADQNLLDEVASLAANDPQAAFALLVPRLREQAAPSSVHLAYRQLLRQQNEREALLVHGQVWIGALIAAGESRRALGVLDDCRSIDADFVPDDTHTCGELADLAARLGMPRVALQLCRGYLARWPRDRQSLHYGLLAVRLLNQHPDQSAEASALLEQLASRWPDPPEHTQIDAARRQLTGVA